MSKVEKIKAEIERLKNELSYNKERLNLREIIAVNNCYNNLILFINSLEEEPVSNDLEEAAKEYSLIDSAEDINEYACYDIKMYNCFKAGAQWQLNKIRKEYEENRD